MSSKSIGLIVPPANPNVEPEARRLFPEDVDFYVTRLPVASGSLESRLKLYSEWLPETARSLSGLGIDAVLSACTGCSYDSDVAADSALASTIGSTLGVPAVTAAGATFKVLSLLGIQSLTVISPYPEWLTKKSELFWTASGFEIMNSVQIDGTGLIYDLSSEALLNVLDSALAEESTLPSNHAILITGTGAPSLRALDHRAGESKIPILSSNLASAWSVLELMASRARIERSPSIALKVLEERISERNGE